MKGLQETESDTSATKGPGVGGLGPGGKKKGKGLRWEVTGNKGERGGSVHKNDTFGKSEKMS